VATLGVATAAITAVLGLDVVNDAHHIAQLRNGMGVPTHSAVATALRTPGHKIATLRDSDDSESALFVIVPDGRGYLMASELPVLSTKQTYQLWGTIGDRTISLGILGREPHQVTFTMSGSPRPSRLGISVEPTGGSIQPSSGMLASGPI
jgi:anti-sigma-K factor RskA